MTQAALDLARWLKMFVLVSLGLVVGALSMPRSPLAMSVLIAGLTFGALAMLVRLLAARHKRRQSAIRNAADMLVKHDVVPCFMTDIDGDVIYANLAARERFSDSENGTLVGVLGSLFASPASVLYRLQNRAQATGSARENVVLSKGELHLATHKVGSEAYLWRLNERESFGDRSQDGRTGENIGLPMMTVSRAGTILFMNEALRRLLGGRETTLDRVFTDLPLRAGEVHQVMGAHGRESVFVTEIELSAGRRELYLMPEPKLRLMDSAEWGVVEGLPVPLLKLAEDGTVAMANERGRTLLGGQDIVGRPLSDLVEGLGRPVSDWLSEAWRGRNLGRVETVRASLPSEECFIQVTLEQVHDEHGVSLVAVLTDATEMKNLETQFVQSQKMQAIGQLAGGVAHDFNNLLTAISGHCDLLLLRHMENDPDFADLTQISQNSNRAAALVGQLLAFSRKQTLRPEVIDLADSMGDMTHLLGRLVGERIQLDFDHDHIIQPIRADKRQLEQVVMNLVVNARDAMPDGGRIGLEVRNTFLDRPLERDRVCVAPGDYVTIRVIDGGTGIPKNKISKIFEPFFTTKRAGQGTGLGLSMAYGIIKQSGGYIFVDSVEGSGTTFTLYFPVFLEQPNDALVQPNPALDKAVTPLAPQAQSADLVETPLPPPATAPDTPISAQPSNLEATVPKPTHETGAEGGIVLLVEDEAPVRAFASRALRLRGFTVLEAESAEEALRTLEDQDLSVDVFVTDVIMPGMDGPTWVSQALKDRPGVKVVFVSGYAEDSVSEHQARIPNSVFLPKPFSLSELTSTVSQQIH
ncbi:MAG: ATP-binding protein [Maritimibacter sp.]